MLTQYHCYNVIHSVDLIALINCYTNTWNINERKVMKGQTTSQNERNRKHIC